jgi:hypothetical protein
LTNVNSSNPNDRSPVTHSQGNLLAHIEELVPQEEIEQWIEEEPTLEAAARRMEKEYPQLLRRGPRKRH